MARMGETEFVKLDDGSGVGFEFGVVDFCGSESEKKSDGDDDDVEGGHLWFGYEWGCLPLNIQNRWFWFQTTDGIDMEIGVIKVKNEGKFEERDTNLHTRQDINDDVSS